MAKKPTAQKGMQKDAQKMLKKMSLTMRAKLILAVLITAVLVVSLLFSDYIITEVLGYPAPGGAKVVSYDELNVHFLDVGQGDSTIVEFPDGKTMIVDGGDNRKNVAEKIIGYVDKHLDITYFDYAVVTHTDADHCGSMDNVLAAYPAKTVYRPNVIADNGGYVDPVLAVTADTSVADPNQKLWNTGGAGIDELVKKSTVVYKDFIIQAYTPFEIEGEEIVPTVIVSDGRRGTDREGKPTQDIIGTDGNGGEYSVRFYAPTLPAYRKGSTDAPNDYSNIMIIEYQGFEFLLSGDAEENAEGIFVDTYADITFNVDVIKAGHHGSRSSSNVEFLELVASDRARRAEVYVAVSCGKDNSYGHPHEEVLQRYNTLGFSMDNVKRTDTMGDFRFSVRQNEQGEFMLFFNGESLRGVIQISWYSIAGGLWVVSMTVIFVQIKTKRTKKTKKSAAKKGK